MSDGAWALRFERSTGAAPVPALAAGRELPLVATTGLWKRRTPARCIVGASPARADLCVQTSAGELGPEEIRFYIADGSIEAQVVGAASTVAGKGRAPLEYVPLAVGDPVVLGPLRFTLVQSS